MNLPAQDVRAILQSVGRGYEAADEAVPEKVVDEAIRWAVRVRTQQAILELILEGRLNITLRRDDGKLLFSASGDAKELPEDLTAVEMETSLPDEPPNPLPTEKADPFTFTEEDVSILLNVPYEPRDLWQTYRFSPLGLRWLRDWVRLETSMDEDWDKTNNPALQVAMLIAQILPYLGLIPEDLDGVGESGLPQVSRGSA